MGDCEAGEAGEAHELLSPNGNQAEVNHVCSDSRRPELTLVVQGEGREVLLAVDTIRPRTASAPDCGRERSKSVRIVDRPQASVVCHRSNRRATPRHTQS